MLEVSVPVDYDDSKHLYSVAERKYISASQLVEKFVTPFDTEKVAANYAQKHGMSAGYWIDQWATKNEKSKIRGNNIHDRNELLDQSRMIAQFQGEQIKVHADTGEMPWIERPDGVYNERKLWHHGYRIAGRADRIILATPGYNESCQSHIKGWKRIAHVEDYKTNEKLNFTSFIFRNGAHKMMKPPLAHVMDCNWYHYCLQLSTYMFMLEYQGFIPGTMTVIHYPHPTELNPNPQPIRYDVPYMKREVLTMLKYI